MLLTGRAFERQRAVAFAARAILAAFGTGAGTGRADSDKRRYSCFAVDPHRVVAEGGTRQIHLEAGNIEGGDGAGEDGSPGSAGRDAVVREAGVGDPD